MDIDPALVTEEHKRQVESVRVEPDPPADFEDFWRGTLAALNEVPLNLSIERLDSDSGEEDVWLGVWRADSLDGRRVAGPISVPKRPTGACWVYGHGYGSIQGGCGWRADLRARGLSPSAVMHGATIAVESRGTPAYPGGRPTEWTTESGISWRGAIADTIRTVQVARAIEGADPDRTILTGGSFSGGTAVLAAPWIEGLRYVAVRVPTFGAYDLRRTLVKRGSGAEINGLMGRLDEHGQKALRDTLRYFDSVNAAAFIRSVPVTVGLGVSDAVVPGETVAAIYHALATDDKELLSYPCSHTDHPLSAEWRNYDRHVLERALELSA